MFLWLQVKVLLLKWILIYLSLQDMCKTKSSKN